MDPALWELLRAEAGADGDRVLEAVIRLTRPGIEIPDVRIVSCFGTIATCRIRARDVVAVRARPEVVSLKAARGLSPELGPALGPPGPAGPAVPGIRPTDVRRSPALELTGAGVVVAAVDWGVDVDLAALRWPADSTAAGGHRPGGTRFLSFWDQRDQAAGPRPDPYGYGSVHDRDEIDRALQDPRPYERLGYHPAIADLKGTGTHGTRTVDIAAGNGRGGGPEGIAPDADLVFVHLADRNTGGLIPFGDSVRLLEAVDYISRTAGSQPCVINISAGRICGPKDGTTLVEQAFDELLAATPGRIIVNSAGNYRRWRTHSCGTIAPGEARSLTVVVDPADITLNEVEIWYDGADAFAVRIDPPGYTGGRPVCLGERSDLLIEGRVIGRVYHREHDPNNGDNHIVAYLSPIGLAGNWTITLEARRVRSGRFHAWIERDDSCSGCQARFTPADSNPSTTVGSITTSRLPLIVGAYNGHDPARPAAPFSSRGPTRDYRPKPDLVAPGVGVLAARSAPAGASRNPRGLVRGSGTSYATPHVTGAVALCLQAAGNRLSAQQIRSLVLGSCDPVPDSDPYRFGSGYLNIPRLVADVQQTLKAPVTAPSTKEPTMDSEEAIMLVAAAPAIAYREYLYRPRGQLARWIGARFDVVARPGQPVGRPLREGDVLLQVALGRMGPGRCTTLAARDLELVASRSRLAFGSLVLRPRMRVEVTEPLPVEPAVDIQDTGIDRPIDQGLPDMTAETSAARSDGAGEAVSMSPAEGKAGSGSEAVSALVLADTGIAHERTDAGWRPWTDLILHQVPQPIVAALAQRRISIPRLKDAHGDINLDYYAVKISKMPFLRGKQLTAEALLAYIRRNFNSFVDTNNSWFPPLDFSDKSRWESDNPLGAVINIHFYVQRLYLESGLVVCSRAEPSLWVFTTAHGGPAGYHPVTGNRMFGIRADGNEWVLFTRGADRATQLVDYAGNVTGLIWSGADALWRSFQAKVEFFISLNEGSAAVIQPVSKRWPWKPIESQLSSPPGEGGSSQREEEFLEYAAFEDWEALEEAEGQRADQSDSAADEWLAQTPEMGELSEFSPREQAESSPGWGLYDGLPHGWGQAEAGHD
jgi:subtilisin family serine protease